MDSQIKILQEKYWRAESSLKEEKELKKLLALSKEPTAENSYFGTLSEMKNDKRLQSFQHPGKRLFSNWYKVAASLIVGLMIAGVWVQYNQSQANFNLENRDEAFEVTRQALLLVSSGLNEAKNYSTTQLKQINTPKELLSGNQKINQ